MSLSRKLATATAALTLLAGTGQAFADAPDAPRALRAAVKNDTVVLTWKAPSGARAYQVSRKGTASYVTLRTLSATTWTDRTAPDGVKLTYRVRARDGRGRLGDPATVSTTVPAAADDATPPAQAPPATTAPVVTTPPTPAAPATPAEPGTQPPTPATPAAPAASGRWIPSPATTWQWQLSGSINTSVEAQMYDVDLFDTSAATVAALHAKGRRVTCYFSAGSSENWRPDFGSFPASVQGQGLDGWPGERWLDVRNLAVLRPIMAARLDLCKAKGFDAVEADNVDGYANATGFPLKAADQLAYNRMLAGEAHARGLSIALKNDLEQVATLQPDFDFAINEECFSYSECGALAPFTRAGKAVYVVEYDLSTGSFCSQARALGFQALKKDLDLDATRTAC